jgi:anti-sigma B factor antagonist
MDMNAPSPTVTSIVLPEIVVLPAEIDIINAEAIGAELREAIGHGTAVVIADMSRTVFCDSSGIRQLLVASDRAAEAGGGLRLAIESPAVLRILDTTGVDRLLRIYPNVQAALSDAPGSG